MKYTFCVCATQACVEWKKTSWMSEQRGCVHKEVLENF